MPRWQEREAQRGRTDEAVGFVGVAVGVVDEEEWLIRRRRRQPPEDAEAAAPATLLRPAGLAPQPAVLVRGRRDHLGAAVRTTTTQHRWGQRHAWHKARAATEGQESEGRVCGGT